MERPRSGTAGSSAVAAVAAGAVLPHAGGHGHGHGHRHGHQPHLGHTSPPPAVGVANTPKSKSSSTRPRVCRVCGQHHSNHEPHLYNYKDDVDEDLMCQICLQPFVAPVDTPCSHTFCNACIHNYLKVNPMCPLDRKPISEMTISPSNLVLKRLLDKLAVTCPNSDSCEEVLQRGHVDDHLRYRCSGTLVACQFASAGCDFRGPAKNMHKHQTECHFKKEGITRLPVLEGEVSHVEIPRTNASLGVTIVGGADTPLRCVVVQEVFPEGLIAADGRLQPGDQIIEINGVDMTCASHAQACAALRKMGSVLRLGVYRERIEKYGKPASKAKAQAAPQAPPKATKAGEELLTVTLEKVAGRHLGVRLSANCSEPGIFVVDIAEGSTTASDGRIQRFDRLLFINGQDVRHCKLPQASALIQANDKVSLVVARRTAATATPIQNYDEVDKKRPAQPEADTNGHANGNGSGSQTINHTRSKSAPAINHNKAKNGQADDHYDDNENGDDNNDTDDEDDNHNDNDGRNGHGDHNGKDVVDAKKSNGTGRTRWASDKARSAASLRSAEADDHDHDEEPVYDLPEGEDYMAIYETLDRVKRQGGKKSDASADLKGKSHSMEALETPTPSLKSFEFPEEPATAQTQPPSGTHPQHREHHGEPRRRHRSKPQSTKPSFGTSEHRRSLHENGQPAPSTTASVGSGSGEVTVITTGSSSSSINGPSSNSSQSMAAFLKKALRMEGPQLQQRTVLIKKTERESLGMRIGGGIGSNEGDTPIYIANIHPHGCIGKSKQMKKGDLLLSVDDVSLCGLTHTQAVATLKATISRAAVTLGVMDGPETSFGASNFLPSWMYWQKLPRSLVYPKTVILHRREDASWGFSIVGGADCAQRPTEPIHVLFVVPESPAAKDAKLKCGDRLLAVDGHSLENIPHATAVAMLKQTSTRVVLEVVSWMGTEL